VLTVFWLMNSVLEAYADSSSKRIVFVTTAAPAASALCHGSIDGGLSQRRPGRRRLPARL